jgi:hypothetical protein
VPSHSEGAVLARRDHWTNNILSHEHGVEGRVAEQVRGRSLHQVEVLRKSVLQQNTSSKPTLKEQTLCLGPIKERALKVRDEATLKQTPKLPCVLVLWCEIKRKLQTSFADSMPVSSNLHQHRIQGQFVMKDTCPAKLLGKSSRKKRSKCTSFLSSGQTLNANRSASQMHLAMDWMSTNHS